MLAVILACAAVVRADAVADLERHQQSVFEQVAPAVVFISTGDGFGSGLFVTPDGLVLTNRHVVGRADTVTVVRHDGTKLTGKVVERGADDVDLALVRVPVTGAPVLPLGGAEPRVGAWVASVGHGAGGIWTFNTGMVSNVYPAGSDRPVFQTQIPLNPGSSGGPVVDRSGRVLGIVTSGLTQSNSINFAIRIEVAYRALAGLAALCDCLRVTAPAGIPVFVDGKMVGSGPTVVVPGRAGPHEVFAVVGGRMCKRAVTYPAVRQVELVSCERASGTP